MEHNGDGVSFQSDWMTLRVLGGVLSLDELLVACPVGETC